tara:strand:- start:392 stop:817 length:426 start_codon:yes stop_codon:yes gene_type:complete
MYQPSETVTKKMEELGTEVPLNEYQRERTGVDFELQIGLADQAKLIRLALKEEVPNHPYQVSVKRYAGGCSVRGTLKSPRKYQTDEEVSSVVDIKDFFQQQKLVREVGGDPDGRFVSKNHFMNGRKIEFEGGFVFLGINNR